jgi:hypothetical protein
MLLEPGTFSEICFITADLEASVRKWTGILNAGPFFEFPTPSDNLWVRGSIITDHFRAAIGFSGTTVIEFIEPMGEAPSIFTEVLREKGEGAVHHVYPNITPLTADQYDKICLEYEAKGLEKVMDFEVPGLGRNCFYDARRDLGCYIELLEAGPAVGLINDSMHAAHVAGVEGRPLRSIAELLEGIDFLI